MARRKKGGAKEPDSIDATDVTAGEEESAAAGSGDNLDPDASARLVHACASMASASSIAVSELQTHAAPFLSFAQKARIGALAANFEGGAIALPAPQHLAPRGQVVEGGLSRDQIEAIVTSSVEAAVNQALLRIGATADEPLRDQVQRQVEGQISAQEHRLLEYVKKHLTDSLVLLEDSLDERLSGYFEGHEEQREAELEQQRTRDEVDKQVEDAKDNLLQSIDEVRSIDLGFDISAFAAGLADVVGADGSVDGDEIEVGGEDIEAGDGEIEVGGEEIEAGDGEIEVGGEEIEAGGEEIEVGGEIDDEEEEDAEFEIEVEGDEDFEIELGDADPAVETVDRDAGPATSATESIEPVTLDLDVAGAEDGVEIELGAEEDDLEIDFGEDLVIEATAISAPPDDGAAVEEISVIREIQEDDVAIEIDGSLDIDEGELVELDLGELEDDDDNPALMTLGTGPDDINSLSVAEVSSGYEVDEIEDEPMEADDAGDTTRTINRYLQRAAEMRTRNQSAAALELYSKVLDLDQNNYEAHVGRGIVHLEAKDYKRSVEEFTRAEGIDPGRPDGSLGLAEVHFHRKQFNKAIRHYTQCLKLDDKLAQAYCNRGLSYYYQKNYKKAFLDLMKAYDLDSELPNIKKYLKLVRNKVKTDTK